MEQNQHDGGNEGLLTYWSSPLTTNMKIKPTKAKIMHPAQSDKNETFLVRSARNRFPGFHAHRVQAKIKIISLAPLASLKSAFPGLTSLFQREKYGSKGAKWKFSRYLRSRVSSPPSRIIRRIRFPGLHARFPTNGNSMVLRVQNENFLAIEVKLISGNLLCAVTSFFFLLKMFKNSNKVTLQLKKWFCLKKIASQT